MKTDFQDHNNGQHIEEDRKIYSENSSEKHIKNQLNTSENSYVNYIKSDSNNSECNNENNPKGTNQSENYNFKKKRDPNGLHSKNMYSPHKKSWTPVVFWIILSAIMIFNFLLVLGSESAIAAITSITIFIFLIVFRKKLYRNKAYVGLALLSTLLITTAVPIITAPDDFAESNKELIDYNVTSSTDTSIEKGVFSTKINLTTFEPLNKVSSFRSNDPIMYYVFKINTMPEGTNLICTWYFEGEAFSEAPSYFHERITDEYFQVNYTKGNDVTLPDGRYKIHIIGRKDARIVLDMVDEIEVKDTIGTTF